MTETTTVRSWHEEKALANGCDPDVQRDPERWLVLDRGCDNVRWFGFARGGPLAALSAMHELGFRNGGAAGIWEPYTPDEEPDYTDGTVQVNEVAKEYGGVSCWHAEKGRRQTPVGQDKDDLIRHSGEYGSYAIDEDFGPDAEWCAWQTGRTGFVDYAIRSPNIRGALKSIISSQLDGRSFDRLVPAIEHSVDVDIIAARVVRKTWWKRRAS